MENKVIMSLKDYNALKRKADALEQAVSIQTFSTWVDCKVDPQMLAPYVKARIQEAIDAGEIDESRLTIRPAKDWLISSMVADLEPPTEE